MEGDGQLYLIMTKEEGKLHPKKLVFSFANISVIEALIPSFTLRFLSYSSDIWILGKWIEASFKAAKAEFDSMDKRHFKKPEAGSEPMKSIFIKQLKLNQPKGWEYEIKDDLLVVNVERILEIEASASMNNTGNIESNSKDDNAMRGGIDFNSNKMNLQVKGNKSVGIKFYIDPAQLAQLQNAPGFTPVIINIQPMNNLREFLGIDVY